MHSKMVVSSGGALHTPALLLRSKFTHNKIGKFLSLHPVLAAAGVFSSDVSTGLASGVSMGVVVRNPIISGSVKSNQKTTTVSGKGI